MFLGIKVTVITLHVLLTCVVTIAKTINTSQSVLLQKNWLFVGLRIQTSAEKVHNKCRELQPFEYRDYVTFSPVSC